MKEEFKNLTVEERAELIKELQEAQAAIQMKNRQAYEELRKEFVNEVFKDLKKTTEAVLAFRDKVECDAKAFYSSMREYGQLRKEGQESFTVISENQKIVVKSNKVKSFDERADIAAEKLIEFLNDYISSKEKGAEDPMYQLAITLLERNRQGNFDYKSISKLYELEVKFNDERYKEIMDLFRESNVVEGTAVNYYFYERNDKGAWIQIEPSFCRMQ